MKTAQEIIASLPPKCYSVTDVEDKDTLILIRAGLSGFQSILTAENPQRAADLFNKNLGVTKAQHDAMVAGSMFGWGCPGADPDNN